MVADSTTSGEPVSAEMLRLSGDGKFAADTALTLATTGDHDRRATADRRARSQ